MGFADIFIFFAFGVARLVEEEHFPVVVVAGGLLVAVTGFAGFFAAGGGLFVAVAGLSKKTIWDSTSTCQEYSLPQAASGHLNLPQVA